MRIHFDNTNFSSTTGPNSFARRLAICFHEMGVELTSGQDANVSLVFIEPSGNKLAKKVVQRLDGIWFSEKEFHTKNQYIKDFYNKSDVIIFQSNFDHQMVTKWWGQPRSSFVINNGVSKEFVENSSLKLSLERLRTSYKNIFVCSSNWHGQKRFDDNVRLFKHLRQQNKSSCLLVLGNNAPLIKEEDVYILGALPHEMCMQIYRASDWLLHLAWADHCPNVVVEALSQGTPVVCAETGGTKEIVGSYGVVLKETHQYNFELFDYSNPPTIDVSQVNNLPDRKDLRFSDVENKINIRNVAQNYLEVLKGLV